MNTVEKGAISRRSLLEEMDTEIRANSSKKTEMGQVEAKCEDW